MGLAFRLRCEVALFSRLRLTPPDGVGRTGAGEETPAREVVLIEPAAATTLRELALDEVRLWPGLVARWCEKPGADEYGWFSAPGICWLCSVLAEVEDALEATDRLWAARSIESSRLRRLT